MNAVDIGPVDPAQRTQSAFDLFLIFAGANIVATTLQTGASLVPAFGLSAAIGLVVAGSLVGSCLVGALAEVGPRLGVPSVIAARAALGMRGASAVALLLYAMNFAWIAVNNVIAGSACAQVLGGPASHRAWAVGLGIASTVIVAGGPRVVALADRFAVPLLAVVGAVLTVACLGLRWDIVAAPGTGGMAWVRGFDIVVGYQVSWILMFADYSRYTASRRRAVAAVFVGLLATSVWLMPLGFAAARAAGSPDPGAMMRAVGLGTAGAVLMTVATLTTNFVNIYMSALAIRSLAPRVGQQASIWSTGLVGAGLSVLSGAWLDQYSGFMLILGGILVPVGGILLARFFVVRAPVDVASLYERPDRRRCRAGFNLPGLVAWGAGSAAYYLAGDLGGTVPSLAVSVGLYVALTAATARRARRADAGLPPR